MSLEVAKKIDWRTKLSKRSRRTSKKVTSVFKRKLSEMKRNFIKKTSKNIKLDYTTDDKKFNFSDNSTLEDSDLELTIKKSIRASNEEDLDLPKDYESHEEYDLYEDLQDMDLGGESDFPELPAPKGPITKIEEIFKILKEVQNPPARPKSEMKQVVTKSSSGSLRTSSNLASISKKIVGKKGLSELLQNHQDVSSPEILADFTKAKNLPVYQKSKMTEVSVMSSNGLPKEIRSTSTVSKKIKQVKRNSYADRSKNRTSLRSAGSR